MRGGFGIFYDRTPTNVLINPSGNPPFNVTDSIFDGNIDNPAGGTERDFPSNLTMLPRSLKTPSVISFNFGVQQQLPGGAVLTMAYERLRSHSEHQFGDSAMAPRILPWDTRFHR